MTEHRSRLRQRVRDHLDATEALLAPDCDALDVAARVADVLVERLGFGGSVLLFGNGGSAADADHLAGELLGRFYLDRPALPAVALPGATAASTAIANDYGYADVFARQVEGLGRPGDVAWGLTTSGNSPNVVAGLEAARARGLVTVAFTGAAGGKAAGLADLVLRAPSEDTPRVQEVHMLVGHTVCELVEAALLPTAGQR